MIAWLVQSQKAYRRFRAAAAPNESIRWQSSVIYDGRLATVVIFRDDSLAVIDNQKPKRWANVQFVDITEIDRQRSMKSSFGRIYPCLLATNSTNVSFAFLASADADRLIQEVRDVLRARKLADKEEADRLNREVRDALRAREAAEKARPS